MDEDYSKDIIFKECSTEEDKSQCALKKQKDRDNEITYNVPRYFNAFNLFEWVKNILDILDVSYERACMATAI